MDINSSHLPYQTQHARRGSSSFSQRLGKSMPLRGISTADWLQIASVVVAAAVVWIALYYTR
jgi:hypothetical protein